MGRLPHACVGLFAGIGLIAGSESSDLLEPSFGQAKQEGTILMAAQAPMVYGSTLNDIDGKPLSAQSVPQQGAVAGEHGQLLRQYTAIH